MIPPTIQLPDLDGFVEHYGVKVALIGEDGDWAVALGHVEPRRALAAFNRMARVDLGWRDFLGEFHSYGDVDEALSAIKQTWAALKTECDYYPGCGGPDHAEDSCTECREIRAAGWWLDWDDKVTADTPGAFPITYIG